MISANQNLIYPIALVLSIDIKKTCSSLARTVEISEHKMWRVLGKNSDSATELKELAKRTFRMGKKIYLILDDTLIAKIYSKYIEGSSRNHNSSNNKIEWGLCSIVAMLTDGKIAIPITLRNWMQKEIALTNYKSKADLAKELVEEITKEIRVYVVVMDGLYAHESMMQWLNEQNLQFEMRMHANRVVESENGEVAQLRSHPVLQLKGRQRTKTVRVKWKNLWLHVTAIKRFNKNGGCQIVYQVSNYFASAKKHHKTYSYRWNIEKFFRTAKQHLGLTHCQSRKLDLQINHQLNVFIAYAILQLEQHKLKLESPEAALRRFKNKNLSYLQSRICSSYQIFSSTYA
jgi:hypothetical protein